MGQQDGGGDGQARHADGAALPRAASDDPAVDAAVARAAALIAEAGGMVVAAGAGMGVDSGLPDFRGEHGFWRAYPALGRHGIAFESIASPAAFRADPALAWGFYGHRLNLYRATVPHRGFAVLRALGSRSRGGTVVFTSNVDGQFQKAGFGSDVTCEVHGSIHHLQCLAACHDGIWSADSFLPVIDEEACRLVSPLPRCPRCGGLARPNVLMFGDWEWVAGRSDDQQHALLRWLDRVRRPVVVELGAGTQVPTVRRFSERFVPNVIRINPTESTVPGGAVSLALGAAEALDRIAAALPGG